MTGTLEAALGAAALEADFVMSLVELSQTYCNLFSSPALIAGGAVGLLFAIFLILLLVYRMKKKDEGSYDLGKKPIYKKAPTNEFYA